MIINSKASLIKLLETCRDSHKPWAKETKSRRYISPMSPTWNEKVIEEYQEAIDFIRNKLDEV